MNHFSQGLGWIDDSEQIWGNRTGLIPGQVSRLVDVRVVDRTSPLNWHVVVLPVPAGCAVTVRYGAGGGGSEFNTPAAGGIFTVPGAWVVVEAAGQAGGAGGVCEAFCAPAWCPVSVP